MKSIFLLAVSFLFFAPSGSAITLASNKETNYIIIVPEKAGEIEKEAASVLSDYLYQLTGAVFPIQTDTFPQKPFEIVIGNTSREHDTIALPDHPDGFTIRTWKYQLYFTGGSGNGVLYAVYTFLEKYCGCRKYSADAKVVPKISTLYISNDILIRERPAVDFREYFYTATVDEEYMEWHKLQKHFPDSPVSSWGMWVHTMNILVPAEKYFNPHPEYYSLYSGKRQPAQLCLSNPEVFELLVDNLRSEMKKKPAAKYWSVSQNDNYGYCQCPECSRIDSLEGSHSGSVIRFVNKVAALFPDKIISTLAYQYSRSAPKMTKPLYNVNIMFCSIECDRSRPISQETGNGSFSKDFEDWSRLTQNILVWDYVVQFSNYISPFPNFKVLQPNIQFFTQHGVRDIFEQGSSSNWSDFGELKAYVISALLWNPDANLDSLYSDFMFGFYGEPGESLLQYLHALEANLDSAHVMLDIYGNPVTPNRSWLSPVAMDSYDAFLKKAKDLSDKNSVYAGRVQRALLPMWYARLEQAKFYGTGDLGIYEKDKSGKWKARPEIKESVSDFVIALKKQNITSLNENHYAPDKYLNDWQRIFAHGMTEHFGLGKTVSFEIPFSPKYPAKGAGTLTDGIGGYDDYHYNWLGWEGTDMIAILDLGEIKSIRTVSCDFMEDQKSWIFFPSGMEVSYSVDGKIFTSFGLAVNEEVPHPDKNFRSKTFTPEKHAPVSARFVKVIAHNLKTCPQWHIGAGYSSWIFCDEIIVR